MDDYFISFVPGTKLHRVDIHPTVMMSIRYRSDTTITFKASIVLFRYKRYPTCPHLATMPHYPTCPTQINSFRDIGGIPVNNRR